MCILQFEYFDNNRSFVEMMKREREKKKTNKIEKKRNSNVYRSQNGKLAFVSHGLSDLKKQSKNQNIEKSTQTAKRSHDLLQINIGNWAEKNRTGSAMMNH